MFGLVLNVDTNSLLTVPRINKLCLDINHFSQCVFVWAVTSLMDMYN